MINKVKLKMKKLIFFIFVMISYNSIAQDAKNITLIVAGQGKTIDEARTVALRSAIEQAFGVFISSKTEILNNDLIADNISTISNGYIQKYTVLDQTSFNNEYYSVTLRAEVSLNKLATFLKQNGMSVNIDGQLVVNNYILKDIYEKNEFNSALNYFTTLKENYSNKNLFEIELFVSEPFRRAPSQNFYVPMRIKISPKEGLKTLASSTLNFLKSISIDEANIETYRQMNIPFYPLLLSDNFNKSTILYFRNPNTIMQIVKFNELYLSAFDKISISNEIRNKKLVEFGNLQLFKEGWLGNQWFEFQHIAMYSNITYKAKGYSKGLDRAFLGLIFGVKEGVKQNRSSSSQEIKLSEPIYFNPSFFSNTKVLKLNNSDLSYQNIKLSDKEITKLQQMGFLKYKDDKVYFSAIENIGAQGLDIFIVDKISFDDLKKMKKYSIVYN